MFSRLLNLQKFFLEILFALLFFHEEVFDWDNNRKKKQMPDCLLEKDPLQSIKKIVTKKFKFKIREIMRWAPYRSKIKIAYDKTQSRLKSVENRALIPGPVGSPGLKGPQGLHGRRGLSGDKGKSFFKFNCP